MHVRNFSPHTQTSYTPQVSVSCPLEPVRCNDRNKVNVVGRLTLPRG